MSSNWQKSYRFNIKRPDSVRRSFDIIEDVKAPEERTQTSIKKIPKYKAQADALTSLNTQLKAGKLTEEQAYLIIHSEIKAQLEAIVSRFSDVQKEVVISDVNMQAFKSYWADKYEHNKKLVDRKRVRDQFAYALRTLEPLSLTACEEKELQRHWDKKLSGTAHRRYGRAVNALLAHMGRNIKLELERNDEAVIEYITAQELSMLVMGCQEQILADAIMTLFCSGVRTGELFALIPRSLKGNAALYIDQQIDRQGVRRFTKNHKKHDALLISLDLERIKRWLAYSHEEKMVLRHVISHRLGELSEKVLGRRVSPHDLRHSYAIYLLEKGVPTDRVAQFLGDTVEVTQKHYTGFVVTDHALSSLNQLVNG